MPGWLLLRMISWPRDAGQGLLLYRSVHGDGSCVDLWLVCMSVSVSLSLPPLCWNEVEVWRKVNGLNLRTNTYRTQPPSSRGKHLTLALAQSTQTCP